MLVRTGAEITISSRYCSKTMAYDRVLLSLDVQEERSRCHSRTGGLSCQTVSSQNHTKKFMTAHFGSLGPDWKKLMGPNDPIC